MDSWDHWRSFLAVVEEGSLSGAARRLGLTQPTLGRHVDALEASVGAALFLRAQAGLVPTDLALSLMPEARAMAAAAATMRRRASAPGEAEAGRVRLAASEVVGAEVLPALLLDFALQFPRIGIDLVLGNRNEDLLRNEADIAVRMVAPTQGALVARRIGAVRLGLYAHRDYLARRGVPAEPAALWDHALIGPESVRAIAGFTIADRSIDPAMFTYRTDNDLAQLSLLRAGLGIGVCQTGIAEREDSLLPVLRGSVAFRLEPWLVMHEDLRAIRRLRLLYDFLAAALPVIWR
jgi:DNA-binding transcriptional LysR family regulator